MKTSIYTITAGAALLLGLLAAPVRADILYVSNAGNGNIEKITSDGGGSVFASSQLGDVQGLAFDGAGNLYAAHLGSSKIEKFTSGGGASVFASGLSVPSGLAFDSAGSLYVANGNNNTIEKFTSGGVGSVFASTGLSDPIGLAFDSAGNLYAANYTGNTIEKFSSPGTDLGAFATNVSSAQGLAFDRAGNLYVANTFANTIEKFTIVGGVITTNSVFASGLSNPLGLAFDSAGNFYVANESGNWIGKFSSAGTDLGVFATGLNVPQYLAFTDDAGHPLPLANQVPGSLGPVVYFSETAATYPTQGILVLDPAATVVAPSSANWQGGSLVVRMSETFSPNVDSLDLLRTNTPGQIALQPINDLLSAVSLAGVEFAEADFQGSTLTVSFTKSTSSQALESSLRSLVFRNAAFNLPAASAYDFPDREVEVRFTTPLQQAIVFRKRIQFPHFPGTLSQAMLYSLRAVMKQTPEGSVLLDSILPYTAEIASLVVADPALSKEMQGVATNFQQVVSAVLSGQSSTTQVTQSQVDQLDLGWDRLGSIASPALQSTLQKVRDDVGGFQQFVGQTVAQSSAQLGIPVPQQPVFYAFKPQLWNGQFSVQANLISGLQYFLRRAIEVKGTVWEPVTNANVSVDGSTVTLTDTNFPAPHLFYQVGAKNSAGPLSPDSSKTENFQR